MKHFLLCAAVLGSCYFTETQGMDQCDITFGRHGQVFTLAQLDAKVDEVLNNYEIVHLKHYDEEDHPVRIEGAPESLYTTIDVGGENLELDKFFILSLEDFQSPCIGIFFTKNGIGIEKILTPYGRKVREIEVALANGIKDTGNNDLLKLIPNEKYDSEEGCRVLEGTFSYGEFCRNNHECRLFDPIFTEGILKSSLSGYPRLQKLVDDLANQILIEKNRQHS